MREAAFVKQNKAKWMAFEKALDANSNMNADRLAGLYIQLTNDLSFAQTYYQDSKTLLYLNSLASQAHQKIYLNKKEKGNKIFRFFKTEFPLFFADYQKTFLYAFAIFMVIRAFENMKKKEETIPSPPPEPNIEEKLLTEIRDLLKKA
jgi:hypothetical protein